MKWMHAFMMTAVAISLPATATAQWWKDPPKMPHLPEIRVPGIKIPPIGGIEIGHKTNKWDVRHNLEKDGWIVAYGKEITYEEYAKFCASIVASVAGENPGPAIAYLQELVRESVSTLGRNAGDRFGNELQRVAEKELAAMMNDAIRHGRIRTVRLSKFEIQLGCATYNRSESGIPLPNTFQPYLRMRMVLEHVRPGQSERGGPPAKYHWVTTIYNPGNVAVNYKFFYGNEWKSHSVPARGWRWHSHDSASAPDFRIEFDMGPPARHERKEYHLNNHRLFIGTDPDQFKGEPYRFQYDATKGWDVFRGRP